MPGDAGTYLAPHDRHAQLITDHSPHSSPNVLDGRSVLDGRRALRRGTALGGGRALRRGRALGGGRALRRGRALGGGFWPGIGAGRHTAALAGRLYAVLPQLGEPVVHLEHAGVVWPDLDLHVGPPLEPTLSVVQPRVTCLGQARTLG
jgi:hypothetical protein